MLRTRIIAIVTAILLLIMPTASAWARTSPRTGGPSSPTDIYGPPAMGAAMALFDLGADSSTDVWLLENRGIGTAGIDGGTFVVHERFPVEGLVTPAIETTVKAGVFDRVEVELVVGTLQGLDGRVTYELLFRMVFYAGDPVHDAVHAIVSWVETSRNLDHLSAVAARLAVTMVSPRPASVPFRAALQGRGPGTFCEEVCLRGYEIDLELCTVEAAAMATAAVVAGAACLLLCPASGVAALSCAAACVAAEVAALAWVDRWHDRCTDLADKDFRHCTEKCSGTGLP